MNFFFICVSFTQNILWIQIFPLTLLRKFYNRKREKKNIPEIERRKQAAYAPATPKPHEWFRGAQ